MIYKHTPETDESQKEASKKRFFERDDFLRDEYQIFANCCKLRPFLDLGILIIYIVYTYSIKYQFIDADSFLIGADLSFNETILTWSIYQTTL